MEEVIWVEILRHRDVAARFRFAGGQITVGRAYANDVVLDDPFVAPSHARISRDAEGGLLIEDLGTRNGLHLDRERTRRDRIVLDGKLPVRIGQTLIRVRSGDFTVAPERHNAPRRRLWPAVALAGAATVALALVEQWTREIAEPKLMSYLIPLVVLVVTTLIWAGLWAAAGRILAGAARFDRKLLIVLVGGVVFFLVSWLVTFLAYAFGWRFLAEGAFVIPWLILGGIVYAHSIEIRPTRRWLKGGMAVALVALAILLQSLSRAEIRANTGDTASSILLLPPQLRLAPARSDAAMFSALKAMKASLDHDRTEPAE